MKTFRKMLKVRRAALIGAAIVGGTAFANGGCMNLALSLTPCGTILAGCTAGDWANLIFPYLDLPDFRADPSCTVVGGCGANDSQPNIPGFFDNATGAVQPTQNGSQGAGGALGGGGGGGGI